MLNKELYPKAYKEVIEILKYVPQNEVEKIPKYILKKMNEEMDKQYEYKITHYEDFENQEMLKETETILAVFYRDYWATDEQRERIIKKENYDLQLIEEEKRKKYKEQDLFKNRKKELPKETILPVKAKKEGFFSKLISYLKRNKKF